MKIHLDLYGKDTFIPFGVGSPQYNFVEDLARASIDKNIDWIVVYGYRPYYSSPTIHPDSVALRDAYYPLFEKYGVDLVINSRNHNYQRTYRLAPNGTSQSDPIITDRNTSNYIDPTGPIFVTVGTSGQDLYDFLWRYSFVVSQFKHNGFLDVHVSGDGKKVEGKFQGSNIGNYGDSFTITKSGNRFWDTALFVWLGSRIEMLAYILSDSLRIVNKATAASTIIISILLRENSFIRLISMTNTPN